MGVFWRHIGDHIDLRIRMIIGFSEVITQSPEIYSDSLPPDLLADITAIQRNSQHLAKLVDDVLDLSQIEAGRVALSREWVSLQEIVDEAIHSIRSLFEAKGLYLEAVLAPDLPPVFCDGTRIRQVVINLLSNAGRFTERGGVKVRVECEKGDVIISVMDTGPGIAPEDQGKLFEPFQQLDSSIRRRHGGSGLGLSISKRFIEMHDGRMWLESQVGVGTSISFSLPRKMPGLGTFAGSDARRWFSPYSEYEYRARTRRSKAPAPSVSPRYVLLEQGETLQRLFARYLDEVQTESVEDIEAAIAELNHSPAQALVVNAPLLGSTPAPLEQLTRLPYGTPALACWVPGDDDVAKQLGVVRYLVKPIARDALLSALRDLGEHVRQVLLVDDEQEVLRLFSRMLSSTETQYQVLRAMDGRQALDLLRKRQPDVMLLDLIMPGMNGFQVLREKSRDASIRDVPVLVVSSRDPRGDPIMSDTLTVARGGGLSVHDLLACIQAVSNALLPSVRPGGRERTEKPAG